MRPLTLLAVLAVGLASATAPFVGPRASSTRHYVCYRAPRVPVIDGRLDEAAWDAAAWTETFVDIEGDARPAPTLRTRAKLLWDDTYLYVAAELEEPDVWGTLTERDAAIFHDNDFEVFIDPDGDTHDYYELEINALGTVWDLFLVKPYRDGGPPISGWDIAGLESAVAVQGTINDPVRRDTSWTVELALPWKALAEAAPEKRRPRDGEQWRLNFSRVEWDVDARDGSYVKRADPATGKPLPEHNWAWSPQGAVNMHMPERWGIIQFSDVRAGERKVAFTPPRDEDLRWALRDVYYAETSFFRKHGRYTDDLADLDLGAEWQRPSRFTLYALQGQYEATARDSDDVTTWHIRQDGRI